MHLVMISLWSWGLNFHFQSWYLSDNKRWIKATFAYYFRIFRRKLLLGDISIFQDKKIEPTENRSLYL